MKKLLLLLMKVNEDFLMAIKNGLKLIKKNPKAKQNPSILRSKLICANLLQQVLENIPDKWYTHTTAKYKLPEIS